MPTESTSRRPLKTRDWPFFKKLAAWLARIGVTPNAISFASMVFGGAAGAACAATSHAEGWVLRGWCLAAAVGIQLRLIANLLDGMVAVEGGKGGPTGELWNEAPDRVSDAAILIGAGYAVGGVPVLGWAAALVAVFTAYVRALGASVGAGQMFLGPMAKPHRMAVMTVACVATAIFPPAAEENAWAVTYQNPGFVISDPRWTLFSLALVVIVAGGLITAFRRLRQITAFLRTASRP